MKKTKFMRFILFLVFFAIGLNGSFAQQAEVLSMPIPTLNQAIQLFQSKQYVAAQQQFKTILKRANSESVKADCAYYLAISAIHLNQPDADNLIINFVENYPIHPKQTEAYLQVGNFYFNKAKYVRANKWYAKVNGNNLPLNQRDDFNFKRAYTAFSIKDFKTASTLFSQIQNSKEYGSQAKYFLGYMAYQGDDYNQASAYFNQIENPEKYASEISYYKADLNFKLGRFKEAIAGAKAQLLNANAKEASELSKIIGESYFNLKQYDEAIVYLSNYDGKNGQWNNTDFYQLGYAYYKTEDYDKAISEFNKIINGSDFVAQNAYYHLGESYLKVNKKQQALNAFRNASQMNFDAKIKQDASLNYAKLSYEIGNPYQSVTQVLSDYLNTYNDLANQAEIEALLVDSYIVSRDYKNAYQLLKSMRGSNAYKNAFGKVAFLRGVEVFNESNYVESAKMFGEAIAAGTDEATSAKAEFWQAESYYMLGQFNNAVQHFNAFKTNSASASVEEYNLLPYNLGYAYFKLNNYELAAQNFKTFLERKATNNSAEKTDALARLADSYFASTNYQQALRYYKEIADSDSPIQDYAFFQQAQSLGLLGQCDKKIELLKQLNTRFPTSKYNDDALYDLGNNFVAKGDTQKALNSYKTLQTKYPKSEFVSKTALREGLIYYNSGDNTAALKLFKHIAAAYPNTPEANQAIATARLIYIDLGQVNAYANWVKTLNYVTITDADLDNSTYESAEKQYLNLNSKKAILQFNGYINQFPNGLHATQAHFYLGELYFNDNLNKNALPHYEYVVNRPANEFTVEALYKIAQMQLEDSNWGEALTALKRLEKESDYIQNVRYAQSNLMKVYQQLGEKDNAKQYAELLVATKETSQEIKADAYQILGQLNFESGNKPASREAYAQLEKIATGETLAEAIYYKALFLQGDGELEASNETVQRLVKDFPTYKRFGAMGLIIMAQNHYKLNDAFQATYILENVIQNFSNFEQIAATAKAELSRIKEEVAKTNSSVKTDTN